MEYSWKNIDLLKSNFSSENQSECNIFRDKTQLICQGSDSFLRPDLLTTNFLSFGTSYIGLMDEV